MDSSWWWSSIGAGKNFVDFGMRWIGLQIYYGFDGLSNHLWEVMNQKVQVWSKIDQTNLSKQVGLKVGFMTYQLHLGFMTQLSLAEFYDVYGYNSYNNIS